MAINPLKKEFNKGKIGVEETSKNFNRTWNKFYFEYNNFINRSVKNTTCFSFVKIWRFDSHHNRDDALNQKTSFSTGLNENSEQVFLTKPAQPQSVSETNLLSLGFEISNEELSLNVRLLRKLI